MFIEGDDFWNTIKESEFISNIFPSCKNISIDYGIMEKSKSVYVYPSEFGWSDLGTWGSLTSHVESDIDSNSLISKNVLLYNSERNIVEFRIKKIGVIQGLEGYIIVDTQHPLLICKKKKNKRSNK